MNPNDNNSAAIERRRQIERLIAAALAGQMTVDESEQLQRLVVDDADLRRYYVAQMDYRIALERHIADLGPTVPRANAAPPPNRLRRIDSSLVRGDASDSRATARGVERSPRNSRNGQRVLGAESHASSAKSSQHIAWDDDSDCPAGRFRRAAPVAIGVATLAALASCVALIFYLGEERSNRRGPRDQVVVADGASSPVETHSVTSDATPEYFALVTAISNAETIPPLEVGAGLRQSTIEVRSGSVQLLFWDGATVVIGGPAKFVVRDRDLGELCYGKVRAEVPEVAIGFTIRTPNMRLIDMGTSFGIDVSENGAEKVEVFQGEVLARMERDAAPSAGAVRLLQDELLSLNGAEAVLSSRDAETSPEFGQMSVVAPQPAPELVVTPAYVRSVIEARPLAYWRFDSTVDGLIPSETADGPPLRLVGAASINDRHANHTALLPSSGDLRLLEPAVPFPPATLQEYSMELFFYADWYHAGSLFQIIRPRPADAGNSSIDTAIYAQVHGIPGDHGVPSRSIRFGDREPAAGFGGRALLADYQPRRWRHLVAARDARSLSLYVDGQLVQRQEHDTQRTTIGPYDFRMGSHVGHIPLDYRCFHGELDEVAWYDRPLSADEIASHFAALSGSAGMD